VFEAKLEVRREFGEGNGLPLKLEIGTGSLAS
jgi:hypothetical protein